MEFVWSPWRLGLIVMASMASLFKTGLNSTMLVTQRAETQQNMRAAIDLMVKDISMAGAGLPSGGIQLPTGAGSSLVEVRLRPGRHLPRPGLQLSQRQLHVRHYSRLQ